MKVDVKFSEHNSNFDVDFGQIIEVKVGEEEALAAVEAKVEDIKKAVIWRGGDISTEANIDEIPEAIMNIPADASLAFQTDDSAAHKKAVPAGAEEYALLTQLGGMTHKSLKPSDNLLPYPYASNSHDPYSEKTNTKVFIYNIDNNYK